ncbi:efflux RND transporter periplasmic adaptor subunit [Clostridium psychrophilum]|uniref:efflux RND transporter periplasmic adaptor subunit n=1 Tax=Clostridium psychrophilum TaxID=132926 RepID=UPI001C0DC6CE|nr:efflux RND transporter periplasmic adaptor subunit [Clostridium psychrophilum]MBU3181297.1 efflux RND transporter periplasmic adaptor subunit [Clostridium psychrophilum]
MRKKIIVGVVIVALVGIIAGIQITSKGRKQSTSVKTEKVAIGDVKMYLSTTGTIDSKNEKDYSASATTKISNVNVKIGDQVNKGSRLLTYDTTDLNSQLDTAQINYNNAQYQRQDAINKNNDTKNTIADTADTPVNTAKLSTLNASLLSDYKLKELDNAVALAKLNRDSASNKLSQNSYINSDIDGVVTAVNVVSGQTGAQGTAIVVQDIANLKAVVKVGKYDAANVAIGQQSTISSNGKAYKAKVSNIYPTATVSTAATGGDTTLTVQLDVLEAAPQLKINFDADVDILLNQALEVEKVPAEAILTNKDGSAYLFVSKNDKAVQKNVKLGVQSDTDAEIISGVKVGESVILNPGSTVTNGIAVKDASVTGGK